MKCLFLLAFIVFCLTSLCFSQKTTTKATKPQEQHVLNENTEVEDGQLLKDLQTARNDLFSCYDNYYNKDKSDNKLQTLRECGNSGTTQLAETYGKISKRPNAIKLLLAEELNNNYRYLESQKSETILKSQVELQRILVMQNQRIIEQLEQLLKKKSQ